MSPGAVVACATRGDEAEDDMVPWFAVCNRRTYLLNNACTLVTERHWHIAR